jgi:Ca2+-binding EF-hand superfamily protein
MNIRTSCLLLGAGIAIACAGPLAAQSAAPATAAEATAEDEARLDAVFAQWDSDHNGVLSRMEFGAALHEERDRAAQALESRLRGQFDQVDADDNGAIDPAEYGRLLLVRQAGKAAPPLATFDANHDGHLQFGEYLALVRQMATAHAATPATTPAR